MTERMNESEKKRRLTENPSSGINEIENKTKLI